MAKFRPVRELLEEAMRDVVEVNDLASLTKVATQGLEQYYGPNPKIELKHQGYDSRIDWDTYIVTVNGQAAGYTDGPI